MNIRCIAWNTHHPKSKSVAKRRRIAENDDSVEPQAKFAFHVVASVKVRELYKASILLFSETSLLLVREIRVLL